MPTDENPYANRNSSMIGWVQNRNGSVSMENTSPIKTRDEMIIVATMGAAFDPNVRANPKMT